MRDVSVGTFCTLQIEGVEYSAKITGSTREFFNLLFIHPITRAQVNEIAEYSLTPSQLDFTAIYGPRNNVRELGLRRLLTQRSA